jgi:hypothetical protein
MLPVDTLPPVSVALESPVLFLINYLFSTLSLEYSAIGRVGIARDNIISKYFFILCSFFGCTKKELKKVHHGA